MKALLEALEARGAAISNDVVLAMFDQNPFWKERFGDRGRGHAGKDGRFHLDYLVQALTAKDPAILTRYATWLQEVLSSRGMCTRHLAQNFSLLAEALERNALPEVEIAAEYLRSAERALLHSSSVARQLQLDSDLLAESVVTSLAVEAGRRQRCLDDLQFHLSYLADAIAYGRPETFVGYVRWIAGFLERRGVPSADLAASLDRLRAVLRSERPEIATAGEPILNQALRALSAPTQRSA